VSIDCRDYRRVLQMVQELHRRGYEKLRIAPGMSSSGMHWRCSVVPVSNTFRNNGAMLCDWDGLAAHYTTGQALQFFGWEDAVEASPTRLADLFIERLPQVAAAGFGADAGYARWYQSMMRLTEPDALPIAYSDYFDHDAVGLPCVGGDGAGDIRVPMPPPGDADGNG
jgi:hypothetical protein